MRYRERYYRWIWYFQSSPEQLWPLVADTNRFTHDVGGRPLAVQTGAANARLHLQQRLRSGIVLDYVQEPYEWVYPHRYGFTRRFSSGPLTELRALVELKPRPDGGTELTYNTWARPRTLLGWLIIPIQVGIAFARRFEDRFRRYDRLLAERQPDYLATDRVELVRGARERVASLRRTLLDQGADPALLDRLIGVIEHADSLALAHLRPYALADRWGAPRRDVLKLFLLATRHGLLDFRWDVLCPLCRNPKDSAPTLGSIEQNVHCDTCNIDFDVNFDRSVELTFRPNPAIRLVDEVEYCIGGPQSTPHVAVQQLLAAGSEKTISVALEEGRYRLRTLGLRGGQSLSARHDGPTEITLVAGPGGWPPGEQTLATQAALHLVNDTPDEQLFILERLAWTDQAATAAEVTMLQVFRDLFANEALRPGEQIAVGNVAVLFTDLRNSTGLYREIGDAPAFGLVMDHFDILREAVVAEDGAIVKTLGDSVMAVFRTPAAALRTALNAQRALADPPAAGGRPLLLKAGLHFGPCIAVTLNDRLDYFGSTVNIAARLQTLSSGADVIVSSSVTSDPEVADWLAAPSAGLDVLPVEATLKGLEGDAFHLWAVRRVPAAT